MLLIVAALCAGLFAGAAICINAAGHPARLSCGTELAVREGGRMIAAALTVVRLVTMPAPGAAAHSQLQPQPDGADWTRIEPGGDTRCGLGSPYSFFYREGKHAARLVVYFQGGGACWDWVSCSGLFDTTVEADELSTYRGIFDRKHPDNPFRDDSIVVVPYCTGDVHVGDASRRYGAEPSRRPVEHRGASNAAAALEWIAGRLTPRTVVVTGTSAGSYGALFHAPAIARLFPDARIVVLGDSGVPLLTDNARVLDGWGSRAVLARLWGVEPREVDLADALRDAHVHAARIGARVAQLTSDRDAVQGAFFLVSGSPRWREATYGLLAAVQRLVPGFRSFIVAGADHGLLPTDAFYTYQADGVYLKDWVRRLIAGEAVAEVRCDACRVK